MTVNVINPCVNVLEGNAIGFEPTCVHLCGAVKPKRDIGISVIVSWILGYCLSKNVIHYSDIHV